MGDFLDTVPHVCVFFFPGRLYNATGQLDNLWTQYSINNFIYQQQCYIDEYSNLTLFGIAVSNMKGNFYKFSMEITHTFILI